MFMFTLYLLKALCAMDYELVVMDVGFHGFS